MKIPLKIIFLFFSLQLLSQSQTDIIKAENYIVASKLDSAAYHINKIQDIKEKTFLKKFVEKNELTYADFYQFLFIINKRQNQNYLEILKFINSEIKDPINFTKIDVDYFNIKWILITELKDNSYTKQANKEQRKLEEYVNKFSEKDENFIWAKTKLKTHSVTLYLLEKKLDKGKKLNNECIEIAKNLNDKELEITFMYYSLGFLLYERKVDKYIEKCKEILKICRTLDKEAFFYNATKLSLANAYIFKGGYDKEALKLLEEIYQSPSKIYSYVLYVQLIGTAKNKPELKEKILTKFKVTNLLELLKKLNKLGKNLNSNAYFYLIDKSSIALANHNYYKEALAYKQKAIEITRKIYSQELSASLSDHKVEQAVKLKQKEIKSEKQLRRLYFIITLLFFFLLIFSILSLKKLRKQSEELKSKNSIVKKSLAEKELLMKEMHHRVKNNFQLITSLLELQTEEIKDKKVAELLEKGKRRIQSMSLIHQKLYGKETGLIKFGDFVNILVKELAFLYKKHENLELEINVDKISFDVDTAIPLSLILNELITNSFKYAFQSSKKNILYISLKKTKNNEYKLIFKDNGLGLKENFKIGETKSSGLKLVERLVRQLQGSLLIANESGAKFEIYFKDTETRKEIV